MAMGCGAAPTPERPVIKSAKLRSFASNASWRSVPRNSSYRGHTRARVHHAAGRHGSGTASFEAMRKEPGTLAPSIAWICISIAKNATQISAPVGAEVFSVPREKFEKYGLRPARKRRNFSKIEIPYQIPVVQRSREKPPRERACDVLLGGEGAELRCKRPAKLGDSRHVTSVERKLATTQLAAEMRFGLSVRSGFQGLDKSMA
jgi:hypothetical protein